MKRSKGLTAVAILVLIGGAIGALSNALTLASGGSQGRQLEQQARQLELQRDTLLAGSVGSGLPAQRREELTQQLAEAIALTRELAASIQAFYQRPSVRQSLLVGLALGLAGCAAAIGVLGLKAWGRLLLMGQAAASIPLGWWSVTVVGSSARDFASAAARAGAVMSGALGGTTGLQEALQQAQAMGIGLGLAMLVGWNVFLIWFLMRRSVRAQFAPTPKA